MKSFFRTKQLLSLFICLVIVSSLAIVKHGELLGHSFRSEQKPQVANNDTLRILGNGTAVVNTSALASDITGYGGKVPLNIVIKNGVVENIVALKNDETKEFFDNASALFEKWKGRTIDEAMNMKVELKDASDMGRLAEALKKGGFREREIDKIFWWNGLRYLEDVLR